METAARLRAELDELQIPYRYGGKGRGIIARIRGVDGSARTVALRADMDALPGNESTGLPFASENPGVVHACGHDAHMTMVLGAGALLRRDPPRGDVVLLFQPAEERGAGARTVIEDGGLDDVERIFGGHVTHHYRTGQVMVSPGVITSQSDRFVIRVKGKAGHGARPHEAIDAVSIAGLLIHAVQTLTRTTNPLHPSVITIGTVQAGSAANVIAGEALLEGTIRTTRPEVRRQLHQGLRRIARAAALLHDAKVEVELTAGNPPVINGDKEARMAKDAAEAVFGTEAVVEMDHPSLGSEDFSLYLEEVPGCYVRFGARAEGGEYLPLHSPAFSIDEEVLKVGAAYFDSVARRALVGPVG